jgi:hypothetical protein
MIWLTTRQPRNRLLSGGRRTPAQFFEPVDDDLNALSLRSVLRLRR